MPDNRVEFLTIDEVLLIHAEMIRVFGGPEGIRDYGLLESALFRPRTGYYQDLVEMAAALFESLLMNHPFIDGNKRVAFFAVDIFLRINGYKVSVDANRGHQELIGLLEDQKADKENLELFLRRHIVES